MTKNRVPMLNTSEPSASSPWPAYPFDPSNPRLRVLQRYPQDGIAVGFARPDRWLRNDRPRFSTKLPRDASAAATALPAAVAAETPT